MNNQTLALLSAVPLWIAGLLGAFGGSNGNLDILIGIFMFVFTTWAAIRLYQVTDK